MEAQNSAPQPVALAYATKSDLDTLVKSKDHFIQLFALQGRFFLPPPQFVTWRFIRQVLEGSKELLPVSRIPSFYLPPKVTELTVKNLFSQVSDDQRVMRFIPDTNRPIDKRYFFSVLAAILPDFFETIMKELKESRKEVIPEGEKVKITPIMQKLLMENTPYIGKEEKVGHYLNAGRQWTAPKKKEKNPIDLRRLF